MQKLRYRWTPIRRPTPNYTREEQSDCLFGRYSHGGCWGGSISAFSVASCIERGADWGSRGLLAGGYAGILFGSPEVGGTFGGAGGAIAGLWSRIA
jgi:hypothetical protein